MINSDNIKRNLRARFKDGEFEKFSALLVKYNAILAGGSILSAFHNNNINDLDIYVQLENASNFLFDLKDLFAIRRLYGDATGHLVPPYDQSFLAKNNILYRQTRLLVGPSVGYYGDIRTNIDLMIANVDDITEVPKNFDLTFCMVWYNGRDVLAVHPDDVREKKGVLQPDYVKALLQGNTFTLHRMNKYRDRGYKISYSRIDISTVVYETRIKEPFLAEFWVTSKFLQILINSIPRFQNNRRYSDTQRQYLAHFDIAILILRKMKKLQKEHSSSTLFNFANFKRLFTNLYEPKLEIGQREITTNPRYSSVFSQFNLTINMLLYIIMCAHVNGGINICMLDDKWKKCVEDTTGVLLTRKGDINPHGFNDESIPLCSAPLPPLQLGQNALPDIRGRAIDDANATIESFYDYIITGFIRFSPEEAITLVKDEYPELTAKLEEIRVARSATEAVASEEQRQARADRLDTIAAETAARNAAFLQRQRDQGLLEEDEEDEAAEGEYTLPGTDRQVPGRCFSAIAGSATGEINTSTWYPDPNHILFLIEFAPGLEPDLVCISVDELERNLTNINKIIYKCTPSEFVHPPGDSSTLISYAEINPGDPFDVRLRDIDRSVEYIFFTYGVDERGSIQGYLPKPSVQRIVDETLSGGNARVYTLSFVDTMSHTADKHGNYGLLGVNHCQAGSTALLFNVNDFSEIDVVADPEITRQQLERNAVRAARDLVAAEEALVSARIDTEDLERAVQDVFTSAERESLQEDWADAAAILGEAEIAVRDGRARVAELERELTEVSAPVVRDVQGEPEAGPEELDISSFLTESGSPDEEFIRNRLRELGAREWFVRLQATEARAEQTLNDFYNTEVADARSTLSVKEEELATAEEELVGVVAWAAVRAHWAGIDRRAVVVAESEMEVARAAVVAAEDELERVESNGEAHSYLFSSISDSVRFATEELSRIQNIAQPETSIDSHIASTLNEIHDSVLQRELAVVVNNLSDAENRLGDLQVASEDPIERQLSRSSAFPKIKEGKVIREIKRVN